MLSSKHILISFFVVCLPTLLWGQKVRAINSTEQSWSGGIAGHYGTNYTFVVEFTDCKEEPVPDTLWIGQEPIVLTTKPLPNAERGNMKVTHKKNVFKFEINAGTTHDEHAEHNPVQGKEHSKPHSPVVYNGVALLSYRYKGKDRYYEIKKIMKVYPPVNYP